MDKSNRMHRSIRSLTHKANKKDIFALYQLGLHYENGDNVDQDQTLADKYFDEAVLVFKEQSLQLSSIKLTNFRGITDLDIHFRNRDKSNNLTVIIGDNGAGKTAILEAIAKTLSWLKLRINSVGGSGSMISEADINNSSEENYASIVTAIKISDSLTVQCELTKSRRGISTRQKNNVRDVGVLGSLYKLANTKDDLFNFPMIAYYSVDRASDIDPGDIKGFTDDIGKKPWSKFDGYTKSLKGYGDFKVFFNWFKYFHDLDNATNSQKNLSLKEFRELLKDKSLMADGGKVELTPEQISDFISADEDWKNNTGSFVIDVVSNAIYEFMPGFTNIRIEYEPVLDMVVDKNGVSLSVLQLSQGEKSLMALVADIARRMTLLNPSLDNPLNGFGIVLIDEMDLHLHPKWQQTIAPRLTKTFPNIQFIITTHSNIILTTIPSDSVRILRDGKLFSSPAGNQGAESSRILNRVFKVDSRPPESKITQTLSKYKKLVYLDRWDSVEAKILRTTLDDVFRGEEPELVDLDLYIENRSWELEIEKDK